jgi:hypothetical protein
MLASVGAASPRKPMTPTAAVTDAVRTIAGMRIAARTPKIL